jgi:hypothetical protein
MLIKRFFVAWRQQMDSLKVSKVNFQIQKCFRLQNLGPKILNALKSNMVESKNAKRIIA